VIGVSEATLRGCEIYDSRIPLSTAHHIAPAFPFTYYRIAHGAVVIRVLSCSEKIVCAV
jgi:hypothetical protein